MPIARFRAGSIAACIALCLTSVEHAQSPPQPSASRAAYARAIEKVEGLNQLAALLADQSDARGAAVAQEGVVKAAIAASRERVTRAAEVVAGTSECFSTVSRGIADSAQLAEQYQQTARESLSKAADFSRASGGDAAGRLSEADPVFQRRFEAKARLLDRAADVSTTRRACSRQLSSSDLEAASLATSFGAVNQSTRHLVSDVDVLERLTLQIVAGAIDARTRGWLRTDVARVDLTPRTALTLLRRQVDELDGLARLVLRDPHPDASTGLTAYQDAVLRFVVEQDAHAFLARLAQNAAADCTAAECLALLERVAQQDAAARRARQAVEDDLRTVEGTIQAAPGLGIFARDPSEWMESQRAIERAFEAATSELAGVLDSTQRLADALDKPVSNAVQQALAERREAYRRVFGVPEPQEAVHPPLPGVAAAPNPTGVGAAAGGPVALQRHAFEVLALRSKESPGYGAYTYVIFPTRDGRPEYQALLDAIVSLTPAADPNASREEKQATNLFEIPGKSAAPIAPDAEPDYAADVDNYDRSRALSLVQTAQAGVLTAPAVLRRFQRSPGPFLLTVPVPLEQAKGVTRLLLADLSGYPTDGFQDLVKSYQKDLTTALPANQALWTPPWNQRLALALVSIGVLTPGQNFVALRR
jgi:hypothetical protein